jgi:hypothetical protein
MPSAHHRRYRSIDAIAMVMSIFLFSLAVWLSFCSRQRARLKHHITLLLAKIVSAPNLMMRNCGNMMQ